VTEYLGQYWNVCVRGSACNIVVSEQRGFRSLYAFVNMFTYLHNIAIAFIERGQAFSSTRSSTSLLGILLSGVAFRESISTVDKLTDSATKH
jgi:hypothetical protein